MSTPAHIKSLINIDNAIDVCPQWRGRDDVLAWFLFVAPRSAFWPEIRQACLRAGAAEKNKRLLLPVPKNLNKQALGLVDLILLSCKGWSTFFIFMNDRLARPNELSWVHCYNKSLEADNPKGFCNYYYDSFEPLVNVYAMDYAKRITINLPCAYLGRGATLKPEQDITMKEQYAGLAGRLGVDKCPHFDIEGFAWQERQ